jgi:transcriptional repressor of dcmA and dcmR
MRESEEFLNIKQAARYLNVSETSLRRWTNSSRMACVRVGGKRERRFRRADLLAFVEEHPAAGAAGAVRSHPAGDRHTVIAGIPLPHGSHLCGLYASDRGRMQQAARFLADGLRPGSVCYLAAAPDVRDHILAHLKEGCPSLQANIDAGRLVLSEYAASADAQYDYWETNFVAATHGGAHSLCVVGDVMGGRLAQGQKVDAAVEYEVGYDRLLAQRFPVVTLCQYDVRRFAGLDILKLLGCHQDTFRYPIAHPLS